MARVRAGAPHERARGQRQQPPTAAWPAGRRPRRCTSVSRAPIVGGRPRAPAPRRERVDAHGVGRGSRARRSVSAALCSVVRDMARAGAGAPPHQQPQQRVDQDDDDEQEEGVPLPRRRRASGRRQRVPRVAQDVRLRRVVAGGGLRRRVEVVVREVADGPPPSLGDDQEPGAITAVVRTRTATRRASRSRGDTSGFSQMTSLGAGAAAAERRAQPAGSASGSSAARAAGARAPPRARVAPRAPSWRGAAPQTTPRRRGPDARARASRRRRAAAARSRAAATSCALRGASAAAMTASVPRAPAQRVPMMLGARPRPPARRRGGPRPAWRRRSPRATAMSGPGLIKQRARDRAARSRAPPPRPRRGAPSRARGEARHEQQVAPPRVRGLGVAPAPRRPPWNARSARAPCQRTSSRAARARASANRPWRA